MTSVCSRCETLPTLQQERGTLHLRLPQGHTISKVLTVLKEQPFDYLQQAGIFSIEVGADHFPLVTALQKRLTWLEQSDVHVLFEPCARKLTLADYMEACSLATYSARLQSGWLLALLQEERLSTVFQPIVYSDRPTEVFAYESLMRGRDEQGMVSPLRMLEVARGAGLLFQLDLAARRSAIRHASQHNVTANIFINFSPTSIYDPTFCLRSTLNLIDSLGIKREQIVFEVVESEHIASASHLQRILHFYREQGFRVALDDLGAGYSSLNLLHELKPDFVKLDMALIRNIHQEPFKAVMVAKLIEAAQELNIRVIAEGVEIAEEYHWLNERRVHYQQGYFFAKPGLPPPAPTPKL